MKNLQVTDCKELCEVFQGDTTLESYKAQAGQYGAEIVAVLRPPIQADPLTQKWQKATITICFDPSGSRLARWVTFNDRGARHVWTRRDHPLEGDLEDREMDQLVREALAGIVNALLGEQIDHANQEAWHREEE